jgi:hypothetical protein
VITKILNISLEYIVPSVNLKTSNTYNVVTLFAAVRSLVALYSDWKFDGLYVIKIVFIREAVCSMNAKYLQVMCHSACITTNENLIDK